MFLLILTATANTAGAIERMTPKTVTVSIADNTVETEQLMMYDTTLLFQSPTPAEKRKQGVRLIYGGLGLTFAGLIVTTASVATDGPGVAIAGLSLSAIGVSMTISGAVIKANAEIDEETDHEKELQHVRVYH